jgi:hypothetical protein
MVLALAAAAAMLAALAAATAQAAPSNPARAALAALERQADAAVLVVDTTQPGLPVASGTWWGRTPMSRAAREVIGVAVKYR